MGNVPTVLVIDDELRLAKNIQTYLKRFGFDVCVSGSGEVGLAAFARFKPEIVLLDLELPDLDGIEVLRRMLNIENRVKVIVMSSLRNEETKVSARTSGAYGYLAKPLALKKLRQLLDKARGE